MSTDPDITPRVMPSVDRRHPDPLPESVVVHPEAKAAAIEVARRLIEGGQGIEVAAVMAGLAMARRHQEIARRGATYPLGNGERLVGVHPKDVKVALDALARHGGVDEIMGPIAEDAMARAIVAIDRSRAERAERAASIPYRKPVVNAVDEALRLAMERARVHHVTVSGSRR